MNITNHLLSIMLHFTPLGYFLCAILLVLRRKTGDKSRIMLAISLAVWGILMFASLVYHYKDYPQGMITEIFSMTSVNITFIALFVMFLYPIEVVYPGGLNTKNIIVLFSSCIGLNILLLITDISFTKFYSFGEILQHISEFNVIFRLLLTLYMLIMSFIIFYLPYKYTKSRVNFQWILWFCAGMQISVILYVLWIFTGSIIIRLLLQIYCLIFCLIMTYQELFIRIILLEDNKSAPDLISNKSIRKVESSSVPPLWVKLENIFHEQKVWRDPDLTLVGLASILGTNRTTLSNLINKQGYDGFYSLINTYRIKDFTDIIEHQEIHSIHETFFDVGFRSKATALRYFRQTTGTTPSEYLQQVLLNKK